MEYGQNTVEEDILDMMQNGFDDILEETPNRESILKKEHWDKSFDILEEPLLSAADIDKP